MGESALDSMLGNSTAMRDLRSLLRRLAPLRQPVLILGESGTGKELAARSLHEGGPRATEPFVAINCAAIAPGLAESELFGHVRGAFTGALRDHAGAFSRAGGGTLFLDEIAELPSSLQAKLLRVLEVGRSMPVGSDREHVSQARIVAATHRRLEDMVCAGTFREDLYHRLCVLLVEIPPLRERAEDIPILVDRFAIRVSRELGRPVTVTDEALRAAMAHPWPGNVRALKNAVLRAAATREGPITARSLVSGLSRPLAHTPAAPLSIPRGDYASMNRAILERALAEHGSIRRAAAALGVPRSTLGAWIKRARRAEEEGPRPPTRWPPDRR